MNITRLSFRSISFFCLLLLAGCAPSSTKDGATITLNSFKLSDLNGNPVDFAQLKGKQVFLNIWATWCGPCIQEMPSIAKLQQDLQNENVAFLLASDEDHELINRFASKPVATGLSLFKLENPEDFEINGIPVTFIFDGEGKLKHSEMGARDWSSQEAKELILN